MESRQGSIFGRNRGGQTIVLQVKTVQPVGHAGEFRWEIAAETVATQVHNSKNLKSPQFAWYLSIQ